MEKDYNKMTNKELVEEKKQLENTFKEYYSILNEVYVTMYDLSTEYNKIEKILNERNG